ncbi:MAG: hypothetical protein LBV04_06445, partial [Deferribacteraceae bacterium]|nr:hypothetical protein [Deferribacteraceae bacterium]
MKKLSIILITAVVLIALAVLGNFIMIRATADKAAETVARVMRNISIYEYKRAYLNPITNALYVEGLLIDDEIGIDYVKVSKFNEAVFNKVVADGIDGEITATIDLRGINFASDNRQTHIGRLKMNELQLAVSGDAWQPVGFNGLLLKDLLLTGGDLEVSMTSLEHKGEFRLPHNQSATSMLFNNINSSVNIKELSFKVNELDPVEISSISSISKSEQDGSFAQTLNINGKLFVLNASMNGVAEDNDIDSVMISDFNISYEDKALLDYIITAIGKNTKTEMLEELEYQDYEEILDGDTFKTLVVDFINDPQSITLAGKALGEPVSVYDIINSDIAEHMEIMLTVNDNTPFQIKRNPEYSGLGSDTDNTLGGMIVDFENVRAGRCNFIDHRVDGDYSITFSCTPENVAFFEGAISTGALANEKGPFYIEYNSNNEVTFTDNADGYEAWGGEDESEEYYENANSDKAGGQYLDFITA